MILPFSTIYFRTIMTIQRKTEINRYSKRTYRWLESNLDFGESYFSDHVHFAFLGRSPCCPGLLKIAASL